MTPLVLTLLLAAPSPTVAASAAKTEVRVGESFVVEVKAAGPPGATFEFPKEAGDESVELRESAPGASPPPPDVQRYDAMALAVGDVTVPAIAVPYRLADGTTGTASTEAIALLVESVLPKDPKQQKLADIRPPVALTVGAPFWIALGVAVAALAGLAFWLWRRRRPAAVTPADSTLPPDAEALQALDRLAAAGMVERGEYRPYYIALAEVAKRYLERRLGAPVLEMTSAEMASFLRDHPIAGSFATTVREMAGAADRVKFARGEGLVDEARRDLTAARAVVHGIEERLRPREQVA